MIDTETRELAYKTLAELCHSDASAHSRLCAAQTLLGQDDPKRVELAVNTLKELCAHGNPDTRSLAANTLLAHGDRQ